MFKFVPGAQFPYDTATAAPPTINPPVFPISSVAFLDPDLRLPYTLEWNIALEQALGPKQSVSASYIGSVGRRLLETAVVGNPNANFNFATLTGNVGTSDYDALQIQFQRRVSHGLQALASYAWAHSIDTGSASSTQSLSNLNSPELGSRANRGPSDFDVRHSVSVGMTYDVPAPKLNALANAILRGWSLQSVIQARSASPVDVYDLNRVFTFPSPYRTIVRPDVVRGQALYLYGAQYPGGKALNPNAFTFDTPGFIVNGVPTRQGNLGRNALRGFGVAQWDFGVHRDFPIRESLKLQFRTEMFNVLNHPNFGNPVGNLSNPFFGQSTQMLGRSLDANAGGGTFSSLYQIGGPRSVQLALKLSF